MTPYPFTIDMGKPQHIPIPNMFTTEPEIHVIIERMDGSKEHRDLPLHKFKEWQEKHDGDPDWFDEMDDEDD